jgi:bifunctional non-homologous end joining protein LigD
LQNSINKGAAAGLVFNVFDLIYIDGFNITRTPLRERKRVLAELLEPLGDTGTLRYSDHIEGNGAQFFKEALQAGARRDRFEAC